MGCHATSLTKLRASEFPGEQSAVYTNNWHKSTSRQSTSCWEMTIDIKSSDNTLPRKLNFGKGVEVVTVNDIGVASLLSFIPTVVHTESTDGLENDPYCKLRLGQSKRGSKFPWSHQDAEPSSYRITTRPGRLFQDEDHRFEGGNMDVQVHFPRTMGSWHRLWYAQEAGTTQSKGVNQKWGAPPCVHWKLGPKVSGPISL